MKSEDTTTPVSGQVAPLRVVSFRSASLYTWLATSLGTIISLEVNYRAFIGVSFCGRTSATSASSSSSIECPALDAPKSCSKVCLNIRAASCHFCFMSAQDWHIEKHKLRQHIGLICCRISARSMVDSTAIWYRNMVKYRDASEWPCRVVF